MQVKGTRLFYKSIHPAPVWALRSFFCAWFSRRGWVWYRGCFIITI